MEQRANLSSFISTYVEVSLGIQYSEGTFYKFRYIMGTFAPKVFGNTVIGQATHQTMTKTSPRKNLCMNQTKTATNYNFL